MKELLEQMEVAAKGALETGAHPEAWATARAFMKVAGGRDKEQAERALVHLSTLAKAQIGNKVHVAAWSKIVELAERGRILAKPAAPKDEQAAA